jgi:hypothetical protein
MTVKFNSLKEVVNATYLDRACWLRNADEKDVATAMAQDAEFAESVNETVSEAGRKTLAKSKKGDFSESLQRLLAIEFEQIAD